MAECRSLAWPLSSASIRCYSGLNRRDNLLTDFFMCVNVSVQPEMTSVVDWLYINRFNWIK